MAQEQRLIGILKTLAQRFAAMSVDQVSAPAARLKAEIKQRAPSAASLKAFSSVVVDSLSVLAVKSKEASKNERDHDHDDLNDLELTSPLLEHMPTLAMTSASPAQVPSMSPEEVSRERFLSMILGEDDKDGKESSKGADSKDAKEIKDKDKPMSEVHPEEQNLSLLQKLIKPATALIPDKIVAPKKERVVAPVVPVPSKESVDSRTRGLVASIRTARSAMSKLKRTEQLAGHLLQFGDAKIEAVKSGAIPLILSLVMTGDPLLKSQAFLTLSLLGYSLPPDGPGPRVLSVDGGGARGVVALEILRELERLTGKAPCDMFDCGYRNRNYRGSCSRWNFDLMFTDFIGVSTGALVVAMLAAFKLTADESMEYYIKTCSQLFARDTLKGARRLILSHGYYDTPAWEAVLRKEMGDRQMVDLSRSGGDIRLAVVSSRIDDPDFTPFVFRSYGLPCGSTSYYDGTSKYKLWEAMRASTAAPGFFSEFRLDGDVHQDGGLLTNNPTAIGIHECRLLWPREKMHCVVSIGTGRFQKVQEAQSRDVARKIGLTSWRSKITTIIASATDTEAIHTTLSDLMPASTYFRIQPKLSEDFGIDISDATVMKGMIKDSQRFIKDNPVLLRQIADKLNTPRPALKKANDWMHLQRDCTEFPSFH